jgi:hypothetical protein
LVVLIIHYLKHNDQNSHQLHETKQPLTGLSFVIGVITTAGDVKMKYSAQPSAFWTTDPKFVKVPSVFGYANKISVMNYWNEGLDITNMTGKELVLPSKDSGYYEQGEKIKYNRNNFETVRNANLNGEEVK